MTLDELKNLLEQKSLIDTPSHCHSCYKQGFDDAIDFMWPLIEDLNKISSGNKSGYLPVPPDNKGPSSLAYWVWQEEQSRDIAWRSLQNLEEKLKGNS